MEEDKTVEKYALGFEPDKVKVVKVDTVFE